ncbi:MAG TPA: hypothetical protein VLA71_06460 [Algoriphagus sp.]|nr:hypothetical protein [Algoriphagus sp.]
MYCNRQNLYPQINLASILVLAAALIKASGPDEEGAQENEEESGDSNPENEDQADSNSSENQTRGGEAPSFVDPARTGLVDPARTRFVDPART